MAGTHRRALTLLLATCVALPGCRVDPEATLREALALQGVGEWDAAEDKLRAGLDAEPEHVALLVAYAELALRDDGERSYRPKLALHYAMRADRAAGGADPAAARTLLRAWRATGRPEAYDTLIQKGLQSLHHPDAEAPVALPVARSDRLDLTPENVRRDRADRLHGPPSCAAPLRIVPAGAYPIEGTASIDIAAFCVDVLSATPAPGATTAVCTDAQRAVVCGPMAATLGPPPGCADPLRSLRCAAPVGSSPPKQ